MTDNRSDPPRAARRRWVTALLVSGFVIAAVVVTALQQRDPPRHPVLPRLRSGHGLTVRRQHGLNHRLVSVTVSTAALPDPAHVRILLPPDYGLESHRRYPVLYLFHGTGGGASDWTTKGRVQQLVGNRPLIVVMPDIGLHRDGGGWCTDWRSGHYHWETFHIDQLIPWIDSNLDAERTRSARAIAGLSQGGFCAMSYAARHPDLFSSALSFSGVLDIAYGEQAIAVATYGVNLTETQLDGVPKNSIFGSRPAHALDWAAHDPTTLAGNLRGMTLYQFSGDGRSGPLDPASATGQADQTESTVSGLNLDFHRRLVELGIPSKYHFYGPGTHTWPYWRRDLRQSLDPLMNSFDHPAAPARSISFTSGDGNYSVYGWHVTLNRTSPQLSSLRRASCAGFTLSGTGSGTVRTPVCYRARSTRRVTVRGPGSTRTSSIAADAQGRLDIRVSLDAVAHAAGQGGTTDDDTGSVTVRVDG